MNPLEIERQKINQIDEALIRLLDIIFEVVRTIGKIKKHNNLQVFQPSREQQVLERVNSLSNNSIFTAEIFKTIMQQSRKFQKE